MRRNLERFESWSETYRQMKKVIEDFERIGDRLERRINEVAETLDEGHDRAVLLVGWRIPPPTVRSAADSPLIGG
jgi:hypothetical protein